MEYEVLGEVTARRCGEPVDLGPAKQRAVLAALLIDVNRPVPADQLTERVWGENPPRTASTTLRTYLSRLRTAGCDIERSSAGYVLRAESRAVDLHRVRELFDQAADSGAYEEAFELWRGEPFEGLDGAWVEATRHSLEAVRYEAQLDYHDALLAAGRHEAALPSLRELSAARPDDERLAGQLILALHRSGESAEAVAHYERVRTGLAERLGVDPGPALRRLRAELGPRQLPATPALFVGRERELKALTEALDADGTVVISAIRGTGGVGKTWLALHWANANLDRFPDGQLYVNLRGFDPSGPPVTAEMALRGFLDALGADPATMPVHQDAQAALYRELVADKRMLVVLDNARDTAQTLPLLPGGTTCTVLVTSRQQLAGLVSGHGARQLALDVLEPDEALELLTEHVGASRVRAGQEAVTQLLGHCGGLPLVLGIVGARARLRPDLPLAVFAEELENTRLDVRGDADVSLRAVLSWSWHALTPDAAELFSLLGLGTGPDISLTAVASLAALPVARARVLLRELESTHLVSQHEPGRYRMHDLVRLYAAELPAEAPEPARRRLVEHYLHTSAVGEMLLFPQRKAIEIASPVTGCRADSLTDADAARAWFDAEHANVVAAQRLAAAQGWHDAAWQIAWALITFHIHTGNVGDRLAVWRIALAAAELADDLEKRVFAHRYLATAAALAEAHDEAMDNLHLALELAEQHGDPLTQGHAHYTLAATWEQRREFERALDHAEQALRCYQSAGSEFHVVQGYGAAGWFAALAGHHERARENCLRALDGYRAAGSRGGEAGMLDSLGYIAFHRGDHQGAVEFYDQALVIFREIGDEHYEATILDHLGEAHEALGEHEKSLRAWERARELYRAQGRDAEAGLIDERLA